MPRFELNGTDVTVPENPIRAADIAIGVFFNYCAGSKSKVYLKTSEHTCLDMATRETYPLKGRSKIAIYTDVSINTTDLISEREDMDLSFRNQELGGHRALSAGVPNGYIEDAEFYDTGDF